MSTHTLIVFHTLVLIEEYLVKLLVVCCLPIQLVYAGLLHSLV